MSFYSGNKLQTVAVCFLSSQKAADINGRGDVTVGLQLGY